MLKSCDRKVRGQAPYSRTVPRTAVLDTSHSSGLSPVSSLATHRSRNPPRINKKKAGGVQRVGGLLVYLVIQPRYKNFWIATIFVDHPSSPIESYRAMSPVILRIRWSTPRGVVHIVFNIICVIPGGTTPPTPPIWGNISARARVYMCT